MENLKFHILTWKLKTFLLQQKTFCNNTKFTKFRKWQCLQIYAEAVTVKPETF